MVPHCHGHKRASNVPQEFVSKIFTINWHLDIGISITEISLIVSVFFGETQTIQALAVHAKVIYIYICILYIYVCVCVRVCVCVLVIFATA